MDKLEKLHYSQALNSLRRFPVQFVDNKGRVVNRPPLPTDGDVKITKRINLVYGLDAKDGYDLRRFSTWTDEMLDNVDRHLERLNSLRFAGLVPYRPTRGDRLTQTLEVTGQGTNLNWKVALIPYTGQGRPQIEHDRHGNIILTEKSGVKRVFVPFDRSSLLKNSTAEVNRILKLYPGANLASIQAGASELFYTKVDERGAGGVSKFHADAPNYIYAQVNSALARYGNASDWLQGLNLYFVPSKNKRTAHAQVERYRDQRHEVYASEKMRRERDLSYKRLQEARTKRAQRKSKKFEKQLQEKELETERLLAENIKLAQEFEDFKLRQKKQMEDAWAAVEEGRRETARKEEEDRQKLKLAEKEARKLQKTIKKRAKIIMTSTWADLEEDIW